MEKELTLKKLSVRHLRQVLGLKVRRDQRAFVASNGESLWDWLWVRLQGRWAQPLVLCRGDTVLGFLLLAYDREKQDYGIWRLMIGQAYQGRGYGKRTMELCLSYLRSAPAGPGDSCSLSYEPENLPAARLYRSFGFRETGERDGQELVARRKL